MDYNEFLERLNAAPPIDEAIDSLFKAARTASEESFYLTILDIYTVENRGIRYPMVPSTGWNLAISQFAEFLNEVAITPAEAGDELDQNFLRRLHMLAYSQFWEHLAVQRMLLQLTRICNGAAYDGNLLWENWKKKTQSCSSIYEQIISEARKASLSISRVLELIYSNQIRNAFSHSQFYFIADLVSFENYEQDNPKHVPSLKVSTWDKLFELTKDFIFALFRNRVAADKELKDRAEFEFGYFVNPRKRYKVVLDKARGDWAFQQ